MCGRQFMFMVLYRKLACLSRGYWFPFLGHWPGCRYNAGRHWLLILPWSWLFLDKIWPERVPCQTLTKGSECLPFCVKIPVSLWQRRVCLTSYIWLSFERWLLFFDALPRPCTLVCHVLFLVMSPVGWWFPPRCAPDGWLWESAIVSLWHFWHRFSVCRM